ncbi:MAG: hypothetical protein KFH87_08420 [Bacteroidetes bacterium]|nr:hypothetical protein [Bacteroidota bacterium]
MITQRNILCFLLLFALSGTGMAEQSGTECSSRPQNMRGSQQGRSIEGGDTESARGKIGLFLAIGSVNGLRGGLRIFLHPAFALEAAGGYMQVTLLRENERKEFTNGWSATLGSSWYSHPEAMISPMISLHAVYMRSASLSDGFSQRRVAFVPALGSEYFVHETFSLFFRFGPAFQFITERGNTEFETATQFDAGLSLLF